MSSSAPRAGCRKLLGSLEARGFRIDGAAPGHRLGSSVSAAGDVDGDGYADVLVGAPNWSWGDDTDGPGAAFLVRGGPTIVDVDLAFVGSPQVTRFSTMGERDQTGISVSSTPDMDGDGRAELLVGAPGMDAGGAAFVVFSTRASGEAVTLGSDAGIRFDGVNGSRAGFAVSGVADVNGDGLGDLAVGAPAFGAANRLIGAGYVVFGRATSVPPVPDRSRDRRLRGPRLRRRRLLRPRRRGPRRCHGRREARLAFGAPASDRNERPQSGSAYVIAGKPGPEPVDAEAGVRVDGATAGDRLGASVAAVPDMNADQKPEFGRRRPVRRRDQPEDAGAVVVRFGGGEDTVVDAASLGARGFRSRAPPRTTGCRGWRRWGISTAIARQTCSSAARTATRARAPRPARARRT